MQRYSDHDPYVNSETGVLKNRFGIGDQARLDNLEADLVAIRTQEVTLTPVSGEFDPLHLRKIHWHLFRDLYSWAGELRTVDISKGQNRFAHHAHLEDAATPIFENLRVEASLKGLGADTFCSRAAFYLAELNALHPFRGGNGRTQQEFLQALARQSEYTLLWRMPDREETLSASIAWFRGGLLSDWPQS